MSYTYVRAIAKRKERGGRWNEVALNEIPLIEIYRDFIEAKIEVAHTSLEEPHYFNISEILPIIKDIFLTLDEWLLSIGNITLPTTEGVVVISNRTVLHKDIWDAGFNVSTTKMGSSPDIERPAELEVDLLLTKEGVNYQNLYDNCLVTVNGLLHQTSLSESGLYVVGGGKSKSLSNNTQLSLTDFSEVGKLEFIDIKSDMLYKPSVEGKHYQYAYLNLGVDTTNRTVMLSLGGYLHILDNVYSEVGSGLIKIDFNNYPIIQRYYESKDIIDLDTLPLSRFDRNDSQRVVSELRNSEAFIEAFIDLSNTFVIVVDTPNLYVEKHILEKSGLPGVFINHFEPKWPLRTQRGKIKEYITIEEYGKWVLNCESNLIPNYQFEHAAYEEYETISNQKMPSKPYIYDRGFLLEIGKDL
jgi:hypothetical protein